jgi:hypothetical protein
MTTQTALTSKDMVRKFTPNLSAAQRKANEGFFTSILMSLREGTTYVYPAANMSFIVTKSGFIPE